MVRPDQRRHSSRGAAHNPQVHRYWPFVEKGNMAL